MFLKLKITHPKRSKNEIYIVVSVLLATRIEVRTHSATRYNVWFT